MENKQQGYSTLTFPFKAPRWASMGRFLRQQAFILDLVYEEDIDKGWLMESGVVKVIGDYSKIARYKSIIESAIAEYNK